jgi:hypothetical protein
MGERPMLSASGRSVCVAQRSGVAPLPARRASAHEVQTEKRTTNNNRTEQRLSAPESRTRKRKKRKSAIFLCALKFTNKHHQSNPQHQFHK